MKHEAIYGGNLSVLLAIIFFLGLSSDMFAQNASEYMKSQFIKSALILLAVTIFCALSLSAVIFVDTISPPSRIAGIIDKMAFYFIVAQMILLITFTINFVLFLLERVGW